MSNVVLPRKMFEQNRAKLSKQLKPNSVAIFHSNDEMPRNGDQFFTYRQNSDFFYLTGIDQEKSILVVFPDNPITKNREILFLVKSSPLTEVWHGRKLSKTEATEISGIETIIWLEEFEQLLDEMVYYSKRIYLNHYLNPRFSSEVESRDLRFAHKIRNLYPTHSIEQLFPILTELRLIKEAEEINVIRHACSITAKAFDRVLKFVKPNVYEFEIDAEISHEFRRNGAQGHAYPPIIATGENACILHYEKNASICKDGEVILMDFGAEFANYNSDCSRTIPVNGRFTKRQKDLYNATLNVFKKTRAMMIKGTSLNHIGKQVAKLWEEEHIKLGLYSLEDLHRQDQSNPLYTKYFMHGVSHYMGLDVHDVGTRYHTLEPGMILTCEPGIYIREEGIGIRLENDILVTEEEPIDLMNNIPIEAEEIEERMNGKK
jgi:Xaa-Pro aminopeptidase